MPRRKNKRFITFNDGILEICELKNRIITRTKYRDIRFGNQTVGAVRFWQAKVASSTIDTVVAVPHTLEIDTSDICIIFGKQYKIKQVQDKFDQSPPCLFLSLGKNPITYKDERCD